MSFIDAKMSIDERVAMLAPVANKMIEEYILGLHPEGESAFQEKLLKMIAAAGLSDTRWLDVTHKVGVHPDNRDQTGLVPIDVHDLLLRIWLKGW